jgi:hypothetical protein
MTMAKVLAAAIVIAAHRRDARAARAVHTVTVSA